MIKVSLIIPVYNSEKYLVQCLESVQKQTLKDIEIICINDGSMDSSLKILKDFASKDKRFIIIDKKNKGAGVARNIGISKASGETVLCLDSDDWLEENALELAYNKITNDHADILFFNATKFYEKTNNKSPYYYTAVYNNNKPFTPEEAGRKLFLTNGLPLKMYKTNFLKENNIKYSNHYFLEDNIFYFKAMINAKTISCLNQFIYNYRVHPNSTTFNYNKYVDTIPEVYALCFNLMENINNKEILKSFIVNRTQNILYYYSITPFFLRKKYYKMIKKVIEKHFIKYEMSDKIKDIQRLNFWTYELKTRLYKTLRVIKTYG